MTYAEPNGVLVRVALPRDVDAAGALTAEAYLADRLLTDDDGYEAELRDARRRAREAVLLVAVVPAGNSEAVVGSLTLAPYGSSYAEVARPGESELRMLAVAPEARRQGLAAELVLASLREAVAGGADRVVLSTLDSMRAAHRLYERLGFVAAPERDWAHEEVHLAVHTWTAPEPPGALVEAATWPPVRRVDIDGWRVGLSGGVTRRANSVLPLVRPADLGAAIDQVEHLYAEQNLPPTFRVEAQGWAGELRQLLLARGYREVAVTDVLVRAVGQTEGAAPHPHLDVAVAQEPDAAWLAAWNSGKGGDARLARALLTGVGGHYLSAVQDSRLVGIARLARDQDWAGLSSLAVVPDARRTGVARALTSYGLHVASQTGARRAFLQVEADNVAAWRLYARAGFRPATRYAYLTRAVG
ncbi:MAG: GNAT family N-acetyltransferase [Cellulomonas sp.]|nr:GNAT family N-acetyltransferase [Cellulomonas sp.]